MATLTNRANAYYTRTLWEKYSTTNSTSTYAYLSSATSQWNSGYYRIISRFTITPEEGKQVEAFTIERSFLRASSSISGKTTLAGYVYDYDPYNLPANKIPTGYICTASVESASLTASKQTVSITFTFDTPITEETTLYIWWTSTRAISTEKRLVSLASVVETDLSPAGGVRIKYQGTYRKAIPYIKVNGKYCKCVPYIKKNGIYKLTN